jgi:hypothetical protein
MANKDEKYLFPWGFHLGDLCQDKERIPLYTNSNSGGFTLLYDDISEKKADILLESLALELLSTMPNKSLKITMFDSGKKKFYNLSPLQYIERYEVAHSSDSMSSVFENLEKIIISRHQELLCCNRKTINEHNQKSKMKQNYHLVLINLANFFKEDYAQRRIQNFIESSCHAGVYLIPFGHVSLEESKNLSIQSMLKHFPILKVKENDFAITPEIFEFRELLEERHFEPLNLDKATLLQTILSNADLEKLMDPENIKLEENTKVF